MVFELSTSKIIIIENINNFHPFCLTLRFEDEPIILFPIFYTLQASNCQATQLSRSSFLTAICSISLKKIMCFSRNIQTLLESLGCGTSILHIFQMLMGGLEN